MEIHGDAETQHELDQDAPRGELDRDPEGVPEARVLAENLQEVLQAHIHRRGRAGHEPVLQAHVEIEGQREEDEQGDAEGGRQRHQPAEVSLSLVLPLLDTELSDKDRIEVGILRCPNFEACEAALLTY